MEFTGERLIPDDPSHRDLYWEHVARYQLASPLVAGKKVLDLGCGCGYGSDLMAEAGASEVLGVDSSPEAIAYAQARYQKPKLSFQIADATDTKLPEKSFDVVVCFELIEHLAAQEKLLDEIARLLKPEGLLFISTPEAGRPHAAENPFHVRELTGNEFQALLADRFPQVKLLGQRRLAAIVFAGEGQPIFTGEHGDADYYVAVCGRELPDLSRIVEIPYFQNLEELRGELQRRDEQTSARDRRIVALQNEVKEKQNWAAGLDVRVADLQQQVQDRDVRLVILQRERDEAQATIGYRLHARLAPLGRKLYAGLSSLWRASFFFVYFAAALLIKIIEALWALPRVWHAFGVFFISRRLRKLFSATGENGQTQLPQIKPRQDDPPGMTVVVPSYERRDLLAEYLPSVVTAAARCPFDVEMIVVDDGSRDDTAKWLADSFPQVRVIRNEENLGFAAAANAGFTAASHPVVYLCNSDMELDAEAINHAAQTLWRQGAFAVASAIEMKDPAKTGMETGLVTGLPTGSRLLLQHRGDLGEQARSTLYAGGGAAAFNRQAVLALGGFDSLYQPFYGEDLDLSYRAWKNGWPVLVEPRSKVKHEHRGTIGKVAGQDEIAVVMERNLLLFQWANLRDEKLLDSHVRSLWRDVLRGLVSAAAVRAAWQKRHQAVAARQRLVGAAYSDAEILAGAGSRLWDLERTAPPKTKNQSRLKVLAVAPYCPFPPTHGGAVRMWELLTRLAQKHEVHLAAMVEREEELAQREVLEKHFPRVHLHLRGRPSSSPHWWPASVAEYAADEFCRAVDDMCGEEDYDLIQAEYPILAHALPRTTRARKVITEIDVYHVAYRRLAKRAAGWASKLRHTYEWLRMFRYEVEHADRADLVLAMSQVDAASCRAVTKTPVRVVPNGADTGRIRFQSRPPNPHEVLFVGNFRHTPNVEGVLWLAKKVWPMIREENWRARLLIAGANPPPKVKALDHDPTIRVTGFVEDLSPLYHRAACFIAPVLSGSGTRLKILEAMAAGVPILSTNLGVEGIDGEDDTHFLLADNPASMAKQCLRLLAEEKLRQELADRARSLAESRYDWGLIAETLDRAWREVVR